MIKYAITGANGFVGQNIAKYLLAQNMDVTGLIRKNYVSADIRCITIDYNDISNLSSSLAGIDCIVHCAAKVHAFGCKDEDRFIVDNVNLTKNLVAAAIKAQVKHFIFISTIKVNGESTSDKPFTVLDNPNPQDPYARSKLMAEEFLQQCSQLSWTIIRPPLIYGTNMQGNLPRLAKLLRYKIPLPFKSINNRRSMIGVRNLADFVYYVSTHRSCYNKIYLISDLKSYSTAEIVTQLAKLYQHSGRVFSFPVVLLRLLGTMAGKKEMIARLTESLQVDMYNGQQLDWQPQYNFFENFQE